MLTLILLVGCSTQPVREVANVERVRTNFFPDAIYSRMISIAASDKDLNENLLEVQSIICDGKKARFFVKRNFKYMPPATTGMPLNEAFALKKWHLAQARGYLKNSFYYAAATIEDFPLRSESRRSAYIESADPSIRRHIGIDFDDERIDRSVERSLEARFLPIGQPADLSFLIRNYTFRVPLAVIKQIEPDIRPVDLQYLGYEDGKFSPSLAVQHQDYLVKWILKNSTTLSEDPAETEGEINFQTTLDLGQLFCPYAIPSTSLISN